MKLRILTTAMLLAGMSGFAQADISYTYVQGSGHLSN